MEEGLVSTIIPVFNRSSMLREAVASVLAQTYRPIEILLVDDGSTDDTPAVCAELASQHPDVIRVLRQANAGPGMARETGRQAARGEFVQHLDSDDLLLPTKFAKQVAALREHPECAVSYCYTRYYRIGQEPQNIPWKRTGLTVPAMFPTFLLERWWDTPTPLYRRRILDEAGPWTNLRLEEDWEYDCRVASFGTGLVHVREFLVDVRDHAQQRLSRSSAYDPVSMRHRAEAHSLIYRHSQHAGIPLDDPHMRHFARELFLLARQCGAAGLPSEARQLFDLAREASGPVRARRLDFRVYRLVAGLVGWSRVGRLACWLDQFRANAATISLSGSVGGAKEQAKV